MSIIFRTTLPSNFQSRLSKNLMECQLILNEDCFEKLFNIVGFHTIPRDTKDNSDSDRVGVQNKGNNQNYFVKSTPTWPP